MAPGDQAGGWDVATYGEPCTGCGFRWHRTLDDAVLVVAEMPDTYARVLAGATGRERHPDLAWSVSVYICHVGDNLRIWAERLAGIARGAPPEVGGYDETALGQARGYGTIPLPSALWSLDRAVADWREVVEAARADGPVLIHPERGAQSLADVARSDAHDAFHHHWDIRRSLDGGAGPRPPRHSPADSTAGRQP
jgi:hypothetical protein